MGCPFRLQPFETGETAVKKKRRRGGKTMKGDWDSFYDRLIIKIQMQTSIAFNKPINLEYRRHLINVW
jgi:hypothetical protein